MLSLSESYHFLLNSLTEIMDSNHYLRYESERLSIYQQSFAEQLKFLFKQINIKKQNDIFNNKLRYKSVFTGEKKQKFIQSACELSVVSFFAERFPKSFIYEPKLNEIDNSSVECQFDIEGFKVNIEVKCPTFEKYESQKGNFHIKLPSRGDNETLKVVNDLIKILNQETRRQNIPEYIISQRMDNTIKDYLISANKKFTGSANNNNINVLIICCDDIYNMQDFLNIFFQDGGFFNYSPDTDILKIEEYMNIDLVILTNLFYRHNLYFRKEQLYDCWDFSKAFNLIWDNLHRLSNEKQIGVDYLREILIPNHTREFLEFAYRSDYAKSLDQKYAKTSMEVKGLTLYLETLYDWEQYFPPIIK